jgi:hypothetical protein
MDFEDVSDIKSLLGKLVIELHVANRLKAIEISHGEVGLDRDAAQVVDALWDEAEAMLIPCGV